MQSLGDIPVQNMQAVGDIPVQSMQSVGDFFSSTKYAVSRTIQYKICQYKNIHQYTIF
jgi:hypothetical protein